MLGLKTSVNDITCAEIYPVVKEAVEKWKRTGILPNGEYWQPFMEDPIDEEIIRNRVNGIPIRVFYEKLCSCANLSKEAAKSALLHLQREGYVRIVWRSPKGARFYPIRKAR